MVNPLMFLGFPIFVVKCRTQPSPSGICLLISSESFKCLHIISLMCNIILLPSLGSAVSMWWLADDQIFIRIRTTAVVFQIFLHFAS